MHTISIISIDQTKDYVTSDVLGSREINFYNNHVSVPRKRNFIAGRLASKMAYQKHDMKVDYKSLNVLNDLNGDYRGKPRIFKNDKEIGSVSIGHSKSLACAIYDSKDSVGVDIEFVGGRDRAFYNFNFTPNEKQVLEGLSPENHDQGTTMLWTAKEAMSKVVGKGLSLDTLDLEIVLKKKQMINFMDSKVEKIEYQGVYKGYKLMVFDLISHRILHKKEEYYLTIAKKAMS